MKNKSLQIIQFGFLTWLIPFGISFLVFPFRASQRGFFESVMAITVTAVAVVFSMLYLRGIAGGFLCAGVIIGGAWFAINLIIDLLLFLPPSPMQMPFIDYFLDIGLTYLIYPIVALGFGYLLERRGR